MQFDEVLPQHFSTISRTPLPHIQIDQALQQVAGGDLSGAQFRKDALAAAGWKHHNLIPFGQYPDEASKAFNRIREAMAENEEPKAILAALSAMTMKK